MNPRNDTELSAFSIADILAAVDLIDRSLGNPLASPSAELRIEARKGAVAIYEHLKTRSTTELVNYIWEIQEYFQVP